MICKNCKSSKIKSRRNYPHGSKSSAIVSLSCKMCGSTDIDSKPAFNKRRRR
jgi:RNase P subunit RPR2